MHRRAVQLPFRWPDPPLAVALVEPQIPPNTGTIARLCAATGTPLHLVGQPGFRLTSAALRRAGLDYWASVELRRHADYTAFAAVAAGRLFLFSTAGTRNYSAVRYQPGDVLVFGNETDGLPDALLAAHPEHVLGIPMRTAHVRSLNLATAVAIALFEALRQIDQAAAAAAP